MDGIRGWIEAEGTGHWFFVAFPVVLICLLIWFKGRKVRFLIPSLLISIVIINPLFYEAWDKLGLYAYWRILWVVPVIPVVASLVPSFTERIHKGWMKSIVAAAGVGAVMVGGTFLYNGAGGSFVEAANTSKLPDYVVQIADRLLELDEHPRVIAQDPIGVYLRQYTGEIDQLFGRDIYGHIAPVRYEVKDIYLNTKHADKSDVSQYMLDNSYNYFLCRDNLEKGFKVVDKIGEHYIYKPVGIPKVVKEYNEIGQIISISNLNDKGEIENNEMGYSTVHKEYDEYNNLIREWRTDSEGILLNYPGGYTFIQQEWQGKELISRTYLNKNHEQMTRPDGWTKATWTKNESGTRNIHLFNEKGEERPINGINLIMNLDTGPDGWSAWMTPERDVENCCFTIGEASLGEKREGDVYTCQIEIEFRGVKVTENKTFKFWTQGAVDESWRIGNVWFNSLVYLHTPPQDGIYSYCTTSIIDEKMTDASRFEVGFRCDYWESGAFRVRNVKIERGNKATEWSPGL